MIFDYQYLCIHKYLFLPPGYTGDVPTTGYFVVHSPTFILWAPWRNFAVDGDIKPALENQTKNARIYPLSEAGNPPKSVQITNGSYKEINTIPPSTYLFWEYLNNVVQQLGFRAACKAKHETAVARNR